MSSFAYYSDHKKYFWFLVATDLAAFPEFRLYDFVFLVQVELAYTHSDKKDILIVRPPLILFPTMNQQIRGV